MDTAVISHLGWLGAGGGPRSAAIGCLAIAALLLAPGGTLAGSPGPSPEPTCGPAPDHLAVPPVGAAWIGAFEGVLPSVDGGPPVATWSIEEILAGAPPIVDGELRYTQPACDPIIDGHDENLYVVTTADPAGPVTSDSVLWRLDHGQTATLVSEQVDTALDTYGLHALDAVRALIATGDMPATMAPPSPSPCPLVSAGPGGSPSPDASVPVSTVGAAVAVVRDYQADVAAGRYEQAWARIAPESQERWPSFDAWRQDGTTTGRISSLGSGPDTMCSWVQDSGYLFADARLGDAWLIEVGDGGMADVVWIAAPTVGGDWRLWLVR